MKNDYAADEAKLKIKQNKDISEQIEFKQYRVSYGGKKINSVRLPKI